MSRGRIGGTSHGIIHGGALSDRRGDRVGLGNGGAEVGQVISRRRRRNLIESIDLRQAGTKALIQHIRTSHNHVAIAASLQTSGQQSGVKSPGIVLAAEGDRDLTAGRRSDNFLGITINTTWPR